MKQTIQVLLFLISASFSLLAQTSRPPYLQLIHDTDPSVDSAIAPPAGIHSFIGKTKDSGYVTRLGNIDVPSLIEIRPDGSTLNHGVSGRCSGQADYYLGSYKKVIYYIRIVGGEYTLMGYDYSSKVEKALYASGKKTLGNLYTYFYGSNRDYAYAIVEDQGLMLKGLTCTLLPVQLSKSHQYIVTDSGFFCNSISSELYFCPVSGPARRISDNHSLFFSQVRVLPDYGKGGKNICFKTVGSETNHFMRMKNTKGVFDTLYAGKEMGYDALIAGQRADTTYYTGHARLFAGPYDSLFFFKVFNRKVVSKQFLIKGSVFTKSLDIKGIALIGGKDSLIFGAEFNGNEIFLYSVNYSTGLVKLLEILKPAGSSPVIEFHPNSGSFHHSEWIKDFKGINTWAWFADSMGNVRKKQLLSEPSASLYSWYFNDDEDCFYLGSNKNGKIEYQIFDTEYNGKTAFRKTTPTKHGKLLTVEHMQKQYVIGSGAKERFVLKASGEAVPFAAGDKKFTLDEYLGRNDGEDLYSGTLHDIPGFVALDTNGSYRQHYPNYDVKRVLGNFWFIYKNGVRQGDFIYCYSRDTTFIAWIDGQTKQTKKLLKPAVFNYMTGIRDVMETGDGVFQAVLKNNIEPPGLYTINFNTGEITPSAALKNLTGTIRYKDKFVWVQNGERRMYDVTLQELKTINMPADSRIDKTGPGSALLVKDGRFLYYSFPDDRVFPVSVSSANSYTVTAAGDDYFLSKHLTGPTSIGSPLAGTDTTFRLLQLSYRSGQFSQTDVELDVQYYQEGRNLVKTIQPLYDETTGTLYYSMPGRSECRTELMAYRPATGEKELRALAHADSVTEMTHIFRLGRNICILLKHVRTGREPYGFPAAGTEIVTELAEKASSGVSSSGNLISPNPVSHAFTFKTDVEGQVSYVICNAYGNEVKRGICQAGEEVEVSGLSSGYYVFRVITDNKRKSVGFLKL